MTRRRPPAVRLFLRTTLIFVTAGLVGCGPMNEATEPDRSPSDAADPGAGGETRAFPDDPHSHSRPNEVSVRHLTLDLDVDFESRRLSGRASLDLDRHDPDATELVLDTWGLDVEGVSLDDGEPAGFELGDADPALGRALTVELGPETETVHVDYATRPDARAVQWLTPEQTATESPFLFTQSQAILARSWIPLQDTPAVRFTYDATIRVPAGLLAVMSADNPTETSEDGVYSFEMPQAVPSYLMALAVGDLAFRSLGPQSGVYAEPPVVEAAAEEFADTEAMIEAASELYGPYRWGRYDLLVLPPSFPFGGMENPRLTFATPTILAGDRSLVTLVAHELAHSWSGNLVTNANWNDFWLNEGFTVYFERRIMEEIEGEEYAEMLWQLGLQDLKKTIEDEAARDTWLKLDLAGRDPDDGMTDVAYEKGALFLRLLEETVGRERFDAFLRTYFERFAFESMDTESFLEYLERELLEPAGVTPEELDVQAWVYGPGIPDNAPAIESDAFRKVEAQIARFREGTPPAELETEGWSTHEWLHFLRGLPRDLPSERMVALDDTFGFTATGNSEILAAWLELAIVSGHVFEAPAVDAALADFLTRQGRRKFLKPLYTELAKTPEGKARAEEIYAEARPGYHAVSTGTIDEILEWDAAGP
ncbi:MAG TPA: M1 family metallopeptidase [Thermoanaerobaculia bacterium]